MTSLVLSLSLWRAASERIHTHICAGTSEHSESGRSIGSLRFSSQFPAANRFHGGENLCALYSFTICTFATFTLCRSKERQWWGDDAIIRPQTDTESRINQRHRRRSRSRRRRRRRNRCLESFCVSPNCLRTMQEHPYVSCEPSAAGRCKHRIA